MEADCRATLSSQTASAFWSVLVAPLYPIMSDILRFINVRRSFFVALFISDWLAFFIQDMGTVKGITKDLWGMVRALLSFFTRGRLIYKCFVVPNTRVMVVQRPNHSILGA